MKRLLSVLIIVAVLLGVVASAAAQTTPTELTFWTFVDAHANYWLAAAEAWNADNPDRPINLVPTVYPWDEMHNKLQLALQSGVGAPDMVDIENSRFPTFIQGDIHLQDITGLVDSVKDNLVDTRLIYQWQGVQYGVDYHIGTFLMFYNKDVMDAAGVDINSIITWDDYIEAGKKVTQGDVVMTSLEETGCFPGRGLMLMNGGGVYDADGNLIIDSEKNAEALQFMADLVHVHNIAIAAPGGHNQSPEFYTAMNEGKIASVWMPEWYIERFQSMLPDLSGQIYVRPMPVWSDKPDTFASTMGGGTGTSITDQIASEEVQLAKDFLAYGKLTHDAGVNIWTGLGFDPIIKDVYDDPEVAQPLAYFGNEDVFSTIKAMLPNLAPEYSGPLYADVMNIFGASTCYAVIEDQANPADVLADLRYQVEAMQ